MDEDLPEPVPHLMRGKGKFLPPTCLPTKAGPCGIYQNRIVGYGHRNPPVGGCSPFCSGLCIPFPDVRDRLCSLVPGFSANWRIPSTTLQAGSSLKTSTGSFLYAQPLSRETSPESSAGQALRLANRLYQLVRQLTETCTLWNNVVSSIPIAHAGHTQHLRKHGADSSFRRVRSSWLPLSRADRKSLRKAPRFLAAKRWHALKRRIE